jgi:hypothetical protein
MPHPGYWCAAPVALQARSASWPRPGARAGLPVCFESRSLGPRITTSQDFLSGGSRSRRLFGAKSSGHQQLDVPRYLLKAKFSLVGTKFSSPSLWQLRYIQSLLSGGELLRLRSVVRWPTRSTGTLAAAAVYSFQFSVPTGWCMDWRVAPSIGAACLAAPCIPLEVFACVLLALGA